MSVAAGDYIVRGDQPYRTLADMYFSLQNYAPGNPSPYDDTGWTFQLMRNLTITPVSDKAILDQKMTLITGTVTAFDIVYVDSTAGGTSGFSYEVTGGSWTNVTTSRPGTPTVTKAAPR